MNPYLFIVIVNWNLKFDTTNCIQSLVLAGADPKKIIVVDNGSQDSSVEYLRKHFTDALQIIELESNLGFAAGANHGIRATIKQGAKWVLIINNDTWVAADFFERLFAASQTNPEISAFGPAIFFADNPEKIWNLGERLIPGTMLTVNRFRGKLMPINLPAVFQVDFLSGCAMLIKREAIEETGLLDTSLFMYGEEVDWCWRARQNKQKLAIVPSARMWHKVSASSLQFSSNAQYLRIRNQIWEYRRYGNVFQRIFLFFFTFIRVLLLGLRQFLTGHKDQCQSSLKGWTHGWLRVVPPICG